MARTKVSKLIRVRQGKSTVELELIESKLTISLVKQGSGQTPATITINKEAVDVLRELLGELERKPTKLATELPAGTTHEQQEVPADADGGPDFKAGMA